MFCFSLNLNIERAVFLCYYIECIIIVKGIGNITLSTGPFFLVMYFIYTVYIYIFFFNQRYVNDDQSYDGELFF